MAFTPQNDPSFDIATGRSRRQLYWKNKTMHWSELLDRLSKTHRTAETLEEYAKEPKGRQDEIKDIGGFVGGMLAKGRRNPASVIHRQLVTLDLDSAPVGFWEDFIMLFDFAACIYSTHKHSPAAPRLRLVFPLDRPVTPTEYEAIGRRVAGQLGIEHFDHTGFQSYRLMYWPSTSSNGEYVFEWQDGELLSADSVLSTYQDFTDSSQWPVSAAIGARMQREITKQGDPLLKKGLIGAFCRRYSISEAIETFLSDVYEPVEAGTGATDQLDGQTDRYTFVHGSTAGGLVVYEDKYAYSHHGTDIISGKLCNAFDLVRLHLYHLKDEDASERTSGTKLPSYKAMVEFAMKDPEIKMQIGVEKQEQAQEDFADTPVTDHAVRVIAGGSARGKTVAMFNDLGLPPDIDSIETGAGEPDNEWLKSLDIDSDTTYKSTTHNIVTILRHDPIFRGRFALNEFESVPVVLGSLPWQAVNTSNPRGRYFSDSDAAHLRHYLETAYDITGIQKIKDALVVVFKENAFHPVRSYLRSLGWDGVERINRVLTDYMGAAEDIYTAEVARKWFTAAVGRIMQPGIKFDNMLVLLGEEGVYKSTFFHYLSAPWFTDNFSFHMILNKQAAEQIAGAWMVEVAELSGLRLGELEAVKAFLARTEDKQRGAYKEWISKCMRQNIFGGSSNDPEPLKGSTGNRRFWVVQTRVTMPRYHISRLLEDRAQLWAEAVHLWDAGAPLHLTEEVEAMAKLIQEEYTVTDDRFTHVLAYLDKKLPDNWEGMSYFERRVFLADDDITTVQGTVTRQRVSAAEIWVECLGCQLRDMTNHNTKPIHDIMRKMPGWKPAKSKLSFGARYGVQRGYVRITSNDEWLN